MVGVVGWLGGWVVANTCNRQSEDKTTRVVSGPLLPTPTPTAQAHCTPYPYPHPCPTAQAAGMGVPSVSASLGSLAAQPHVYRMHSRGSHTTVPSAMCRQHTVIVLLQGRGSPSTTCRCQSPAARAAIITGGYASIAGAALMLWPLTVFGEGLCIDLIAQGQT